MWEVMERGGVVSLLENSLKNNRLPNAYLVCGPEHVGKMTLALDIARALNCNQPNAPCGQCPTCHKISTGKHPDIMVFDLLSARMKEKDRDRENRVKEIGVEVVDDIIHFSSLPPYEGRYRVMIVDDAEQLSPEAANRLLKTLEEPEERVIYILLTVSEKLVLPTIASRCQKLELRPLPVGDVEKYLINRGVPLERAHLLAHLSRGCLGWALNAAADEFVLEERKERLDTILSIITAGIGTRFEYAARLAGRFGDDHRAVMEELDFWTTWWRDILLVKSDARDHVTNIDYLPTLSELAAGYSLTQIRSFIGKLQDAVSQLKLNASPRLVLEVLMLHIPGRNIK